MSTATEPLPPPAAAPEAPDPSASLAVIGEDQVRGLTLRTRFFLGAAALLVFVLGLAVAVISWKAQRVAEAEILKDLGLVPGIFAGYLDSQSSARRRQVGSLAEEAGTKALMAEIGQHPETFHDSVRDFAKALGARTVFLFDAHGRLLARSDREPGDETGRDFAGVAWVDVPRLERTGTSAFILEVSRERALSLVASTPVFQGAGAESKLNGVLAAAFPITRERAEEVARLTASDAAFVGNVAAPGAPLALEVLAATPRLQRAPLEASLTSAPGAADTLFDRGEAFGPYEFSEGGERHIGIAVPIRSGGGEVIAALITARSKEAEMAPFREIRRSLLVVGALALALAVPLSFALASGLSSPIRQLAESAARIGRGELEVPVPEARGGEVGTLARAFTMMVSELKEKAQLEALVTEMQRRPGDVTYRGSVPAPVPPGGALEVGRVFAGRYEILSELGRGAMGTVFRVRDRELEDEVALKALSSERDDSAAADRLRQEIRLARQISHPNVVRAFDFGEADGTRYLTMEYVPGTTLRELIDRRHGLELTPALQIAKQICRGLAAVHRAGIIHGDLKPQNVMVMGNGVAKLMDFGVARRAMTLEASAIVVSGTPLYMSPEQARGAELDDRSDIYSAGVVMFEMFTGQVPFRSRNVAEIMQMHLSDPPPDPRALRAGLPEALGGIILACLSKQRLERPASAADLDRLLMRVKA